MPLPGLQPTVEPPQTHFLGKQHRVGCKLNTTPDPLTQLCDSDMSLSLSLLLYGIIPYSPQSYCEEPERIDMPTIWQACHKLITIVVAAGGVYTGLKEREHCMVSVWDFKVPREWETSQASLLYLWDFIPFNKHSSST